MERCCLESHYRVSLFCFLYISDLLKARSTDILLDMLRTEVPYRGGGKDLSIDRFVKIAASKLCISTEVHSAHASRPDIATEELK